MPAPTGLSRLFGKGQRFPGESHLERGRAALERDDPARAVSEIEQGIALGLDPATLPGAYNGLGEAQARLAEFERARAAYRKALDLDPRRRSDWNNLGFACWRAGRLDEAVEAHREALRIDSADANAYNGLGAVYMSLGQPQRAVEALEKSLQLGPCLPVVQANLAMAYALTARFDDAYGQLRAAATGGYDDPCGLKFEIDMLKTTYTLRGKSRQGTWQELLEQAMPDADNADMTSLRYAYALSDEYDPYYEKGGVKATIRQVRQAAESGDAPRTVRAAERLLAMNPMHLETRQHLIEACLDASQEERAVPHQHFLRSCLRSIHGSGYGNSFRNAYVVISLDEEYAFLRMFGAIDGFEYRGKRRLAEDAGHAFDVFEVRRKGGDKDEIYFNIDLITKGVREERARLPDAKEELL